MLLLPLFTLPCSTCNILFNIITQVKRGEIHVSTTVCVGLLNQEHVQYQLSGFELLTFLVGGGAQTSIWHTKHTYQVVKMFSWNTHRTTSVG